MSNANGIISAPVDVIGDVDYVLGTALGDIVGQCQSTRVNKWSLHKPLRVNNPGELSSWASDLGNYGLHLDAFSTLANAISGWSSQWTYQKPDRDDDWCRLTDFNGYDHYAQPQFVNAYCNDGVAGHKTIGINWIDVLPSTCIEIANVKPDNLSWNLGQCYFAVILSGSDGSLRIQSSTTKIVTGWPYRETVDWDVSGLSTSVTYTPYPCLLYSTNPITTPATSISGAQRVIALPISLDEIYAMAFTPGSTNAYAHMSVNLDNGALELAGGREYLYGTLQTLVDAGYSRPSGWLTTTLSITISDGQGHSVTLGNLSLSQAIPSVTFSRRLLGSHGLVSASSYDVTIKTTWGNGTGREDNQTILPH